ncbi:MAG: hypothetical protein HZC55_24580 [Verrucomicrobia bacterium]|nr:hypothetical protein [Verrucomicrobiota bacterium]
MKTIPSPVLRDLRFAHSVALPVAKLVGYLAPLVFAIAAHALPIVYSFDFISNGNRTHFNGFEAIPTDPSGPFPGQFYSGGSGPYDEDGIRVQQINGDPGNSISVTPEDPHTEHKWYPDGGDHGYTKITFADGSDFQDVGFVTFSGGGASLVLYSLWKDGILVASGSSPLVNNFSTGKGYLGFSGGGFDEIHVKDNYSVINNYNALGIDSIETQDSQSTPDISKTFGLVLFSLAGLLVLRSKFS